MAQYFDNQLISNYSIWHPMEGCFGNVFDILEEKISLVSDARGQDFNKENGILGLT